MDARRWICGVGLILLLPGCGSGREISPSPDAAAPDGRLDMAVDKPGGCLGDKPVWLDKGAGVPDLPADRGKVKDLPRPDLPKPDLPKPKPDLPPAADISVLTCPAGMVLVSKTTCMDKYEASRPDATKALEGTKTTKAKNKKGVLPWQGVNLKIARAACKAAGKRLCKMAEWITTCRGPKKLIYSYGNKYSATICNGIDTYCYCSIGVCAKIKPCPYPHCANTCWSDFDVDPTGSSANCKSAHGVVDITGNVWELTDSSDGQEHFRGGAFNCGNSEALHRCDHDGNWGPSAKGFRCCATPK